MKFEPRAALNGLILGAFAVFSLAAQAQTYPNRAVTIVVPYPPGASTDQLVRLVQPKLAAGLGQPVVVENRGGAAGNVGSALVARSTPDGYRILLTTDAVVTLNPYVYKDMGFDPVKDLSPITTAVNAVLGIAVHPSLPVNNLAELIDYARKNPKKVFFGTAGSGSPQHVAGEMLNRRAQVQLVHVPYKGGGPAIADLLAGHIKMGISTISAMVPHLGSGNIRIIAIGERTRFEGTPNIPTIAETLPEFEASAWLAFFAPAGTPRDIVNRLNAELVKALNAGDVKAKLLGLGLLVVGDRPEQLAAKLKADFERRGKILREVGIKPE